LENSVLKQGLTVLLAAWWLAVTMPVVANEAKPMSNDPVLEARVMVIAEELRCLVCQNETIAASHADLAVDLRSQIRIKLTQGQSSQQILDFMVARYGDFVLYRPPLKASTVLLWVGPFALLLLAAGVLVLNIRRHRGVATGSSMTDAEQRRAQQLLDQEGGAS
jgi:cytochrome c-type biogenesis protein CcmH